MSMTSTQEQELVQHVSGVAGVAAYGSGTQVHLSVKQKAALDNAGNDARQSALSETNTVVTADNTGLLKTAERQAISSAVGADTNTPLSGSNPLVANNIPVAVPVLGTVSLDTGKTASYIVITKTALATVPANAINLVCPTLWDNIPRIYVAGQGINSGVSSAYQYFNIEDQYGVAMLDASSTAIYVTNVYWGDTPSTVLNPSAADLNVDNNGFITLGSTDKLWLSLSSAMTVTGTTTFCVRLNVKGRLSNLASTWNKNTYPNYPAATVYRNIKQPFVGAVAGDFQTLYVGSSTSDKIRINVGTPTRPHPGTTVYAQFTAPNNAHTDWRTGWLIQESTGNVILDGAPSLGGVYRVNNFTTPQTVESWSVALWDDSDGDALRTVDSWGTQLRFFNLKQRPSVHATVMTGLLSAFLENTSYNCAGSDGPVLDIEDEINVTSPWVQASGTLNSARFVLGIAAGDVNTGNIGTPSLFVTRKSLHANAAMNSDDSYQIYVKTWNANALSSTLQLGTAGPGSDFIPGIEISSAVRYGLGSGAYASVNKASFSTLRFNDTVYSTSFVVGTMGFIGAGYSAYHDITTYNTTTNQVVQGLSVENYALTPDTTAVNGYYTRVSGFGSYVGATYSLRYNSNFSASALAHVHGAGIFSYVHGTSRLGLSGLFGYRDVWLVPSSGAAGDVTSLRVGPQASATTNGGFEIVHDIGAYDIFTMPRIIYGTTAVGTRNRLYVGTGTYDPTTGKYTYNDMQATIFTGNGNVSIGNAVYFGRNDASLTTDVLQPKYGAIVPYINTSKSTAWYSMRYYASAPGPSGYNVRSGTGGFLPTEFGLYVAGGHAWGSRIDFGTSLSPAQFNSGAFISMQGSANASLPYMSYGNRLLMGFYDTTLDTNEYGVAAYMFTSSYIAPADTSVQADLGTSMRPFQKIYGQLVDPTRSTATEVPSTNTAGLVAGLYSVDTLNASDEDHTHQVVRYSRKFAEAPIHRKAQSIVPVTDTCVIDDTGIWEILDKCYSTAYNCWFGIQYDNTVNPATCKVLYSYDGVSWITDASFATFTFGFTEAEGAGVLRYPRMLSVHGVPVFAVAEYGGVSANLGQKITLIAKNAGSWVTTNYTTQATENTPASRAESEARVNTPYVQFASNSAIVDSGTTAYSSGCSLAIAMPIVGFNAANYQIAYCIYRICATRNGTTNAITFTAAADSDLTGTGTVYVIAGSFAMTVSERGSVFCMAALAELAAQSGMDGIVISYTSRGLSDAMPMTTIGNINHPNTSSRHGLVERTTAVQVAGAVNGVDPFYVNPDAENFEVTAANQLGFQASNNITAAIAVNSTASAGQFTPSRTATVCYAVSTTQYMNSGSRLPCTHMVKASFSYDGSNNLVFQANYMQVQTVASASRGLLHLSWNRYTQEFQLAVMTKAWRYVTDFVLNDNGSSSAPDSVSRLEPSVDLYTTTATAGLSWQGFQKISTCWLQLFPRFADSDAGPNYNTYVRYLAPNALSNSKQPSAYDVLRGYSLIHVVLTENPSVFGLPKRSSAVFRIQ